MSEQKGSAATGQTFAASGLTGEAKGNTGLPGGSPSVAAPYQGGYLSKLFGIGSGTAPSATAHSANPIDEAHEYHPGTAVLLNVLSSNCSVSSLSMHLQNWHSPLLMLAFGRLTLVYPPCRFR